MEPDLIGQEKLEVHLGNVPALVPAMEPDLIGQEKLAGASELGGSMPPQWSLTSSVRKSAAGGAYVTGSY